ncbi:MULTISPECIES: homoprotocatechuate degradation operon regulator HpaR [Alloalcanivorax]|jgi:homoprotocatechuate degradation regulator HpaR|uniref:Homoprotocatechuate degradation operon regulator HpaR n=3 Tax=Alloalcanivorax TaxID=3020832 RepID=A0A9Q3W4T6_9GAMM|nr:MULTISPECIES: homoprotocatechuate degradation operon regulator HpaR [Alloalcanivorax]ERS13265.1 homoprotocatechuate degradation operon regulator HpaR [Alcanivorax sp. PN-3]KYZ87496.1 transcriptional regulator [Alcanivorax sp. KX64203]MBA4721166.1 homoprotocatechuate degradation operon regulator HpaR [Alcanivorax sp.]AFT71566.1 putative transcriptional regulator [Alloalcanivorax dieselolei B5]ARB46632.1 transcriptional regulator [Alloalcanivorax xenomutans]
MPKAAPSLTLALLQGREAVMAYFRPLLNKHNLTEQQWRVIRILKQAPDFTLESRDLAALACILRPSLTGVLVRLEKAGHVRRWKPETDQRRLCVTLTDQGHEVFAQMSKGMNRQYQKIQQRLGEDDYQTLMDLLSRLRDLQP